jgi:hypothetical protein
MGLLHATLQWLLFGFEDTGSLDVRVFIHGRYPKNAHAGPSWPSEESMCTIIDSDKISELLLSFNNREGFWYAVPVGSCRKGVLCAR